MIAHVVDNDDDIALDKDDNEIDDDVYDANINLCISAPSPEAKIARAFGVVRITNPLVLVVKVIRMSMIMALLLRIKVNVIVTKAYIDIESIYKISFERSPNSCKNDWRNSGCTLQLE